MAHKWPGGYITLAAWGVPNASERGKESQVAHMWVATQPLPLGGSPKLQSRRQNKKWPTSGLGGPKRFKAGERITSGPHVGRVAT